MEEFWLYLKYFVAQLLVISVLFLFLPEITGLDPWVIVIIGLPISILLFHYSYQARNYERLKRKWGHNFIWWDCDNHTLHLKIYTDEGTIRREYYEW